jgi:hypothetical protein
MDALSFADAREFILPLAERCHPTSPPVLIHGRKCLGSVSYIFDRGARNQAFAPLFRHRTGIIARDFIGHLK